MNDHDEIHRQAIAEFKEFRRRAIAATEPQPLYVSSITPSKKPYAEFRCPSCGSVADAIRQEDGRILAKCRSCAMSMS